MIKLDVKKTVDISMGDANYTILINMLIRLILL